jgi:hypothetical protein
MSEFNIRRTKYLSFIISIKGIKVDSEKTETIYNWEPLITIRGI